MKNQYQYLGDHTSSTSSFPKIIESYSPLPSSSSCWHKASTLFTSESFLSTTWWRGLKRLAQHSRIWRVTGSVWGCCYWAILSFTLSKLLCWTSSSWTRTRKSTRAWSTAWSEALPPTSISHRQVDLITNSQMTWESWTTCSLLYLLMLFKVPFFVSSWLSTCLQ